MADPFAPAPKKPRKRKPPEQSKRKGMNYLSVRSCYRCLRTFSHPLQLGWKITADSVGSQHYICPSCALPDDVDVEGR